MLVMESSFEFDFAREDDYNTLTFSAYAYIWHMRRAH